MNKVPDYLLLLSVASLFILINVPITANEDCNHQSIHWFIESNTIEIVGNVSCTISQIYELSSPDIPLELVDHQNKIWYLGASLFLIDGAQLYITGGANGDVNELRLLSANDGRENPFVILGPRAGFLEIRNTSIYSYDPIAQTYDLDISNGRANIQALSFIDDEIIFESTMNIYNSDIGYLGYLNGESYGLSWKVKEPPELLDIVNVYGSVENTVIHHNYYGAYSFGAEAMIWRNNEFHNNIEYGLDPHDDSDNLIIEDNYAHHNGNHGIICSKRCNNLLIRNNVSSHNDGHGIMLHRAVNYSLVQNNTVEYNTLAGISIFDSHHNLVLDNIANNNSIGIRISTGSSFNTIENNIINGSIEHGIYLYRGSNIPTINAGRPHHNEILSNIIENSGAYGINLTDADSNNIDSNIIENDSRSESTGIRVNNSSMNAITQNIISEHDQAILIVGQSNENILFANTIESNFNTIDISESSDNVLIENIFVENGTEYIRIRNGSLNNHIENMSSVTIYLDDETSNALINNTRGFLIYSNLNIPNQINGEVVSVQLNYTGTRVVSYFELSDIQVSSDLPFTFLPTIWNIEDNNIFAWQTTAESNTEITFTINSLSNSDFDLLINGSVVQTLSAVEDGSISFTISDVRDQIFAIIRSFE